LIRKLSFRILIKEDGAKLIKMMKIGIFIGPLFGLSEIYLIPNQVHINVILGIRLNDGQVVNHFPNHF
jgi:hypothetical protein